MESSHLSVICIFEDDQMAVFFVVLQIARCFDLAHRLLHYKSCIAVDKKQADVRAGSRRTRLIHHLTVTNIYRSRLNVCRINLPSLRKQKHVFFLSHKVECPHIYLRGRVSCKTGISSGYVNTASWQGRLTEWCIFFCKLRAFQTKSGCDRRNHLFRRTFRLSF